MLWIRSAFKETYEPFRHQFLSIDQKAHKCVGFMSGWAQWLLFHEVCNRSLSRSDLSRWHKCELCAFALKNRHAEDLMSKQRSLRYLPWCIHNAYTIWTKVWRHLHMTPTGPVWLWTHAMKVPAHSFCAAVNARWDLETWSVGWFYTWCASALDETRSVTLSGLPLHAWAAVVYKCFHSVIIALTADCGTTRREEISLPELLQGWHPNAV